MGNKYFIFIKQRNDAYIFVLLNVTVWAGANMYFNPEDIGRKLILLLILPMIATGMVYEYLWPSRQKKQNDTQV